MGLTEAIEDVDRWPSSPEIPEHWQDLLHEEFPKESDRAAVILGAALLDSALEGVLRSRLAPSASRSDGLFEGANAPIGSFSARIELAHRLGLISGRFARDLHLIRKVRNDFAHNITGCTFEDSSVRNRTLELKRSCALVLRDPSGRDVFAEGPRGDFQLAVSWMQWYLRQLCEVIRPIEAAELEWGYLDRSTENGG